MHVSKRKADCRPALCHDVEAAELTVDAQAVGEATLTVIGANVRAMVEDRAAELGREFTLDDIELITYGMVMRAADAPASAYARSVRVLHAAGRRVARFLESYDVLLVDTAGIRTEPSDAVEQIGIDRSRTARHDGKSLQLGDLSFDDDAGRLPWLRHHAN